MPTKTRPKSRTADVSRKAATPRRRPAKHAAPNEKKSEELLLESAAGVGDADVDRVLREANAIEAKAAGGGALDRFLDDIKTMIAMVRAYATRRYRETPIGTIAAIAGALLYVLTPVDFIPDFLAGIGLVDDAAVVRACLGLVGHDVRKFRAWKQPARARSA